MGLDPSPAAPAGGKGSNWENAAVFDFKGRTPAAPRAGRKHSFVLLVEVTFEAKVSGDAAFIDGGFLGGVGSKRWLGEGDAFVCAHAADARGPR